MKPHSQINPSTSSSPLPSLQCAEPWSLKSYISSAATLLWADSGGRACRRSNCLSNCGRETDHLWLAYLSGEQSVGIELLQPWHQGILGVDDILHEAAGECEPIRAPGDLQAFGDAAFAETPHVVFTFMEETVETLFLYEPETQSRV